jgi:hypothetical protein
MSTGATSAAAIETATTTTKTKDTVGSRTIERWCRLRSYIDELYPRWVRLFPVRTNGTDLRS